MEGDMEEKFYKQVEKGVSNNIDENLFDTGRVYLNINDFSLDKDSTEELEGVEDDFPRISRAEYIRQARESCLRQMDSLQVDVKHVETNFPQVDYENEENNREVEEVNSFNFLLIRVICALVIFLSVFFIDKLEVKLGEFSYVQLEEYITGNDHLKRLEEVVLSWID